MAFLKEYSYKQGATLAIGSTFIWKILSFVNSILIAFYFGTQTKSDIYFYIIFIGAIILAFFTSLNTNIIIPQAIYLKKEGKDCAKRFLNAFLLFYITITIVILGIGSIFPVEIFSVFSKFSIDILSQDTLILRLAFLYFCSYILCYFLIDIMYIYHIFSINLLFPLNAIVSMLFLIFFNKTFGLKTMLFGFTISYFIQIIIYLFIIKKKLDWSLTGFKISLEKRLKDNILTNQSLTIISLFTSMVPLYLMSNFTGGIISALSYAKQLTDSPYEIITSKMTQIYHIQLNENASSKDFAALNANYLKVNYLLLFIMIPLAVFTCYFAPDIINLFFKRGKFNTESSLNVVRFLRPLMILLILGVLAPFAASLIASTRKIKESFKYILFREAISIVLIYYFITYFGPFAYPYALISCSILSYIVFALFFRKNLPQINFWQPLKDAVLLVSLNLIALIPAGFIAIILQSQNVFIRIFICGVIFLFTLLIFF